MGTEISLNVGGLSIDWSKNARGADHGALFQDIDRKRLRSDQIDYQYVADSGEDAGRMERAFARRLRDVVPRLELLGFTLEAVKTEYLEVVEVHREDPGDIGDEQSEPTADFMSFEDFRAFATEHSIQSLDDTFIIADDDVSADRVRGRFSDQNVTRRLPGFSPYDQHAYSERSYFGTLIGLIHPYALLRVLADNSANLDAEVVWQYGPLVESGYASDSEFVPAARRTQTFLVVTEGSSDAHVLKYAFSCLRPEVADFFRFIDVSERHPFPGTGNLIKFAEGLAKIDVQNQIVFLFDNDAEGYDAYQRLSGLSLPPNMRAMILPELEAFRAFPAKGPEGVHPADINRRAAAIECYLDLELEGYPPAHVVWTNYKRELATYHGALENKDAYVRTFLKQPPKAFAAGPYDVSKIRTVLDAIVAQCTAIAVGVANASRL